MVKSLSPPNASGTENENGGVKMHCSGSLQRVNDFYQACDFGILVHSHYAEIWHKLAGFFQKQNIFPVLKNPPA